eukprot:jgi/Mesvir1/959/Mv17513-RA.1
MDQLRDMANLSDANQRLLGKVGACELFAAALGRAQLAGKSRIPLADNCLVMSSLMNNSLHEEHSQDPTLPDRLEAVAVFDDLVGQCLVIAVSSWDEAAEAAYEACQPLVISGRLLQVAETDRESTDLRRLARCPPPTLPWTNAFTARSPPGASSRLHWVCDAMCAVACPEVETVGGNRSALARPRVLENLVRIFTQVAPPDGSAADAAPPDRHLCEPLCEIFQTLLLRLDVDQQRVLVPRQEDVCAPVVTILRAANRYHANTTAWTEYSYMRDRAVQCIVMLACDPRNVTRLVMAGVCEEVMEAVPFWIEHKDREMLYHAIHCILGALAVERPAAKRMATNERLCMCLVESLKFFLSLDDEPDAQRHVTSADDPDGVLLGADDSGAPTLQGVVHAAGANAALAQGSREAAQAVGDRNAAEWFRFIKYDSLGSRRGKCRRLDSQAGTAADGAVEQHFDITGTSVGLCYFACVGPGGPNQPQPEVWEGIHDMVTLAVLVSLLSIAPWRLYRLRLVCMIS